MQELSDKHLVFLDPYNKNHHPNIILMLYYFCNIENFSKEEAREQIQYLRKYRNLFREELKEITNTLKEKPDLPDKIQAALEFHCIMTPSL